MVVIRIQLTAVVAAQLLSISPEHYMLTYGICELPAQPQRQMEI